MRSKVNDHAEDGTFEGDIERSTDSIMNADGGSLADNIAAESREWSTIMKKNLNWFEK